MGIKGIYKEIGQGKRISLCKLATEHLERTKQPLRLAIDISIWQFQVQAAQGGYNPAVRTLFYRLARLLGNAVEPVFVFDGPKKPEFKRNKRSGRGDGVADAMAKRMIRLFGFTTHDAPGEAEAECALLQQQGIVDAVLSEDVDTIMFGCGVTLRNWSSEGTKGPKTPTHVTLYDAAEVASGPSGLDREGMVLVALMSGGDYIPEGVPGCGIKVACEAARAGFGSELCRIKASEKDALAEWKTRLLTELHTNESRFFRTKHKAISIPDSFPDMKVLRYYTHPVVSSPQNLDRLKRNLGARKDVDLEGLRQFAQETFDWMYKGGAIKFIRVIASSLLVQQLVRRCGTSELEEFASVRSITMRRAHFSTDATPELRVSFVPIELVKVDLDAEPDEPADDDHGRGGLALNSDDEFEGSGGTQDSSEEKKKGSRKPFDPSQPDLAWIPEMIVRMGVPRLASEWDDKQRAKEAKATVKPKKTTRAKKTDMPAGALDKYVKVTKNVSSSKVPLPEAVSGLALASTAQPDIAPSSSQSVVEDPTPTAPTSGGTPKKTAAARGKVKEAKKPSTKAQAPKVAAGTNPWTIAKSQGSPAAKKSTNPFASPQSRSNSAFDPIIIGSSPPVPIPASPPRTAPEQASPTRKLKRFQKTLPEESDTSESESQDPSRSGNIPAPDLPTDNSSPYRRASPPKKQGARPFKRTKSIEAGRTGVPQPSQSSIRTLGRVVKQTSGASTANKIPVEISDDEDSGDETFPPLSPNPRGKIPTTKHKDAVSLRGGGGDYNSPDADPFRSEPTPSSLLGSGTPSVIEQEQEESDDDFAILPPPNPNSRSKTTTKLIIPRTSGVGAGYFDEIEVPREKADARMMELARAGKDGKRRAVYRLSDVAVLDLTGGD
ncbi:hypothetical protein QBC47DRAFT_409270 [Echria macrotheca]|uniref:Uncharacterized protein n=1 Tax=Echria macrotheca TaxID=438768 RepID=A0AAJ0FAD6_9PEZI|nr:hypothetical protein QBC47DRAFT_409270 [Echria macrotheca]